MQAAELLAVEPGDGDAFVGVNPLQGAAAQAFAAGQLVPPGLPHTSDNEQRNLLTAQKYEDEAPVDAADVISARVLGAGQSDEVLQAQQQHLNADEGDRLLLVTSDVDTTTDIASKIQQIASKIQQIASANREGVTTASFPTFLRGDAVDDPTAVAGQQSGGHGRRLTASDAAEWMSPDTMLLGGVLVFVAVGLVVNRARHRQKLKMDAIERDVLDGQGGNEVGGDDQQDQYVVLM